MQALHDVVKAGYVRYIGMSSCYAYQFHQMQSTSLAVVASPRAIMSDRRADPRYHSMGNPDYAITHNLTPFISMQNHYNLAYREEEREMFPTLKHFGVGSIPWSPLGRGVLTRPLAAQTKRGETDLCVRRLPLPRSLAGSYSPRAPIC